MLSVIMLDVALFVMLSVIMLNAIMLYVIMLIVVMLWSWRPLTHIHKMTLGELFLDKMFPMLFSLTDTYFFNIY